LNPDQANAHHWYAYMLAQMGRSDEAIAQAKRAAELEPLNLNYADSVILMHQFAGDYDFAIPQYKKTLEIDPNFSPSIYNLAVAYRETGEYDLWLPEWKKDGTIANDQDEVEEAEEAARVYAKSGYRAAVQGLSTATGSSPSGAT
jgi:tetratricopeptide (TPR) repeat protein